MAIRTSLIIDLTGNLQARARQNGQALEAMGRRGQAAIRSMQTAGAAIGRSMDQAAGRYTAMIGGGAAAYKAVQSIKQSANLDKSLELVRSTAGASREQVENLRKELYEMGRLTGQTPTTLLQGFATLIASGQSWDTALASIKAINPAMAVTGASADTLASVLTVVQEAFKIDMSDLSQAKLALDQMTRAGRLGNAELEALASIISRIGPNAKASGLDFVKTLAIVERLSQLEKNPERLATLTDSTLRIFTNANYRKAVADAAGVGFFSKDGSQRSGDQVLAEMAAKYSRFTTDKQRADAINAAVGKADLDTQKGLRVLLENGAIGDVEKMALEIKNAGGTIERDLSSALNNSVDQVGRLKTALGRAADDFSRPINDAISRGVKYLLDERRLGGAEMLAGGAAASALGFGALKLGGGLLMKAGTNAAGGIVGGVMKNAGFASLKPPIPVYVVNRQMGLTREAMMGGAPAAGTVKSPAGMPAAAGASVAASGGKWAARLSRATGPAAAAVGALSAANALMDDSLSTAQKIEATAEAGGTAIGGLAGAAAGAAIGSVVPVIGTAIGGILGGILGSLGGGALMQTAASKFNASGGQEKVAGAIDDVGQAIKEFAGKYVIQVNVDGGAASLASHDGPAQVDVYSGIGAFGGID